MFEGPIGKSMMIRQGYVPETCTLDDSLAGPLILAEVKDGRDPCAGCAADRSKCHGRPPSSPLFEQGVGDILTLRERMRIMDEEEDRCDERRRALVNPVTSPWEEIK